MKKSTIDLKVDFSWRNVGLHIQVWSRTDSEFTKATALFDTGAHICAIDTDAALDLGYELDNSRTSRISTATGEKRETFQIFVDKLMFGNFEFGPVLMNVFDLPIYSHPIVIGVNVIKNFDINLKLHENLITMSPVFANTKHEISTETFGDWQINT